MTHFTVVPVDAFNIGNTRDRVHLHRTVMSVFDTHLPGPAASRRATSNILFRVENSTHILIRSDIAPVNLPDGGQSRETPNVDLPEGTTVRFRVAVNAVTRVNGKNDRPVDDVPAWLATRLTPAFTDVDVISVGTETVERGNSALCIHTIDGFARIGDIDALNDYLIEGIGRSKAYGCGLLTIALA